MTIGIDPEGPQAGQGPPAPVDRPLGNAHGTHRARARRSRRLGFRRASRGPARRIRRPDDAAKRLLGALARDRVGAAVARIAALAAWRHAAHEAPLRVAGSAPDERIPNRAAPTQRRWPGRPRATALPHGNSLRSYDDRAPDRRQAPMSAIAPRARLVTADAPDHRRQEGQRASASPAPSARCSWRSPPSARRQRRPSHMRPSPSRVRAAPSRPIASTDAVRSTPPRDGRSGQPQRLPDRRSHLPARTLDTPAHRATRIDRAARPAGRA